MPGVEAGPRPDHDYAELQARFNTEMNHAVAAEIQAKQARARLEKLSQLREMHATAEELELREHGNYAVLGKTAMESNPTPPATAISPPPPVA